MIKIAIVEDEKQFSDKLQGYLEKYARKNGIEISVAFFVDGAMLVNTYQPVYDIIFMDIEMPRLDGMEAARIIRKKDDNVIIIFISNLAQYVISGYEVRAMDFILKPMGEKQFAAKMDKAVESLKYRESKAIVLNSNRGDMVKLDVCKIQYVEVYNHKLHLHTEEGEYTAAGTLAFLEQKLDQRVFVRCNSGYLVNLGFVKRIEQNEVQVANYRLPIGRTRKKAFMQALADYVGGTVL